MYRGDNPSERAWHRVYNTSDVTHAQEALVRAMLNPHDAPCWGFKEIR